MAVGRQQGVAVSAALKKEGGAPAQRNGIGGDPGKQTNLVPEGLNT